MTYIHIQGRGKRVPEDTGNSEGFHIGCCVMLVIYKTINDS